MPKKIFFLTLSLIKGGAENQLVKLAVNLKSQENEVKIIALFPDNDFSEVLSFNKISYQLISFNNIFSLFRVLSFFRKNRPDVIISFMYGANVIGRFVKLFLSIPLITSVRNNEIDKKFYYLYKLTHRIDSVTTFNSSYSLKKFIREKLTIKSRSFLVNNSISLPEEDYVIENKDSSVFRLLSMAHFRPQKDYRTLLKACKILKDRKRHVKLYVLGHLYDEKWPFELIEEYGLQSNVEIHGFVNSPLKFIRKSNAVVLSSLWEGTPNALLEGMANKLPVISSEIPGCKELVESSNSGLLFKVKNEEDLADKIEELMDMKDSEVHQLGSNGYNHILEYYTPEKVYSKWDEIINIAITK